jgi:hypothetical protein
MHIVDTLLRIAYEDTQLLLKNDELGDKLAVPRDVEFLLRANDPKKAEVVCSFINDNQYGRAELQSQEAEVNVLVMVHMPITQNLLCSVSALMACIAHLFSIEYDGWGSVVQRGA